MWSVYRLLYKQKVVGVHVQLPSPSSDGLSKTLWRLEVPPKVRVFRWRVAHEFLPARQVLCRRHIESIAFCEECGDPKESILHVLLVCSMAKEFWRQVRMGTGVKNPKI